jgi:hypothetical protein
MRQYIICASALATLAIGFGVLVPPAAAAGKNAEESGQAIYKHANCVGCHKWHGGGGGGYGGAALSLRKTQFDKEQIIFTVSCGRPGTGMPYFLRGAYGDDKSKNPCGVTMKGLGDIKVAQGGVFLRPTEIAAVADYVLKHIKGKGEPNLADCVAFFGDRSRVCEIYRKGAHHAMPIPTTTR